MKKSFSAAVIAIFWVTSPPKAFAEKLHEAMNIDVFGVTSIRLGTAAAISHDPCQASGPRADKNRGLGWQAGIIKEGAAEYEACWRDASGDSKSMPPTIQICAIKQDGDFAPADYCLYFPPDRFYDPASLPRKAF